ncbi:MAG TPA: hypothetical protein VNM90_14385 [Haliangium sp.]|nr:hypothetical protein [Haliangium sp.]
MRRRRRKRSSELTSLIDVLFILLFASLVQARYSVESQVRDQISPPVAADAGIRDAGPPVDAVPADAPGAADAAVSTPDAAAADAPPPYRQRARQLSALIAHAVYGRQAFVVEVTSAGHVVEIQHWRDGALLRRQPVHHRLIETVPPEESNEELRYLGNEQPGQHICPLVLTQLEPRAPDFARALVVITVDAPLAALPLALRNGLARDSGLCFQEAAGIAILLDPENPLPWSEIYAIE